MNPRRSLAVVAAVAAVLAIPGPSAWAATDAFVRITGSGSTWSQNALDQWRDDVAILDGMTVNYNGTGSSAGRNDFINQTVDFAVSEIPFQANPEDGSPPENPTTGYAYMPIVAGGTSLMYNLKIGGKRVTNLRLSGEVIAKIFSGQISNWNDPAIQADNPSLAMPDRPITPVYRSDGSGTSAQLTQWMSTRFPNIWTRGMLSQFPQINSSFKGQNGSLGVAGYVSQNYGEGAITYVEYSYAESSGFPVAKVLNEAGYYVAPTPEAVSIALLGAQAHADGSLDLTGVSGNTDPRAYPISSASSMIVPTQTNRIFTADKGRALARFLSHALCAGQQRAPGLGYAALPLPLVQDAAARVADIPGAPGPVDLAGCANPTFGPGDTVSDNVLLRTAPMPPASDKRTGVVALADLTEARRTLTVELVDGGPQVRVNAGSSWGGATLRAGTFSPTATLGQKTLDATGAAVIDLPATVAPGAVVPLYLAQSDGTVVAWNTVTIPPAGFPHRAEGDMMATVTASGLFQLSAPVSTAVAFGDLRREATSAARALGRFTITDDRETLSGWSLQISVADFVAVADPAATFASSALGYAPAQVTLPAGVVLTGAQEAGSAVYPAVLATGEPGTSTALAGATLDTALSLRVPKDTPVGSYRSTLTLTLIAR
ncbi:phosphate ABC transporter substrate-binding protein PstS [Microbacterium sp.]|uniref:phosphate ABC transporter substrate-binding protein PstS n=1 Tax=Microbacterium sp. TaxID=51671 RepID=UPI002600B20F|nr:phosphate ABC transporter substrate-binding protein PstS [Microbacterium sp.]MBT9607231.1 phosphate ABC transporter substrate-binding protein PstS [Microbacterium sp.]